MCARARARVCVCVREREREREQERERERESMGEKERGGVRAGGRKGGRGGWETKMQKRVVIKRGVAFIWVAWLATQIQGDAQGRLIHHTWSAICFDDVTT